MKSNDLLSSSTGVSYLRIFKSVGIAYIVTIVIFIILAVILSFTNFPDSMISPAVVVSTITSNLIAGTLSVREIRSKGWLNGSIAGFIYMFILYIFSSLVLAQMNITQYVIIMFASGIMAGAIGGIAGVNLNYKR